MDQLTEAFVDEQRLIEQEKRLNSKNHKLLEGLEKEFQYLWNTYNREDWEVINLGEYCARLESAIMNVVELFNDQDIDVFPISVIVEREREKSELPNPTESDLKSKEFNAIWKVIKSWDVNVPDYYEGYCGANGSHVKLILDALRKIKPFQNQNNQI